MARVHRFRGSDIGLGLLAIVVNIGLVVGIVMLTTGPADPESSPSATPSPSVSASPSATPTPTPTPSPTPSSPEELFAAGPVSLTVLGDQTGDGPGEWVSVVASLLAQDHRVTLDELDPQDPTVYAQEQTLGDSGPKVEVHNASRPGVKASYAASRIEFLIPDQPDIVVLNYGRNDTASSVAKGLERTTAAVRERWPAATVVLTVQPPTADDGDAAVRKAAETWAEGADVGTLDIASAFTDTGQPNAYISGRDPLVMSSAGDRLWGETAYALLTGKKATLDGGSASTTNQADSGQGSTGGTAASSGRTTGGSTTGGSGGAAIPTPGSTTTPTADPSPTPEPTPTESVPTTPGPRPQRPTPTSSVFPDLGG